VKGAVNVLPLSAFISFVYHGYINCKNPFIAVALATPVFDSGLCDI
jgi:hypothetical protein